MKANRTLLILMLAATASFAETRVSVGIHVGDGYGYYPPPPPPVYVYRPPCPGPGYVWVPGYWYGVAPRRVWRQGYWAPPRFRGWHRGPAYRADYYWGDRHRGRIKYRKHDNRGWRGDRGDYVYGYREGRRR